MGRCGREDRTGRLNRKGFPDGKKGHTRYDASSGERSIPRSRAREQGSSLTAAAAVPISCGPHVALFLSGREGLKRKGPRLSAHHMGSIGSKICYEHVSRDDPKQTIDSRSSVSISIFTDEREKKEKEARNWVPQGDVCLPLICCV